ncbi:MAG: hypothetical protein PHS48_03470 [Bacteroidales bacterium]|nr:hypothetical protein [Bacteroidales bacterium]
MGLFIILLIVVFPVCGLMGYYIRTRNSERIKLIEQGLNPDEGLNITEYQKQANLKNGVLLLSLGLGLLCGHLLVINYEMMDEIITYLMMLLIFGGIGFLINYRITNNRNSR